MRKRACSLVGVFVGSIVLSGLSGCGEGDMIPPSKGGAEARQAIEYPLGPPPATKHAKSKKAKTAEPTPGVEVR